MEDFTNSKKNLEFIKDRPQELCKMCGNCCRVATNRYSYKELLEMEENGIQGAIDFLRIFEPYDTVEDARKISAETVDNILSKSNLKESEVTFYKCKYLQENNLCGDYENRPILCRLNPFTPWSIVPPSCGFNGWLDEQKEKKIAEIRHQKAVLTELEELLEVATTEEQKAAIELRIATTKEIIEFYSKYGSKDW